MLASIVLLNSCTWNGGQQISKHISDESVETLKYSSNKSSESQKQFIDESIENDKKTETLSKNSSVNKKEPPVKYSVDEFAKDYFTAKVSYHVQKGNWLYYIKEYENRSGSLYKVKTDGTGNQKIYDKASEVIDVSGGWVYFYQYSDDTFSLCKVKTNGKNFYNFNNDIRRVKWEERYMHYINISGDWIYYYNTDTADGDKTRGLYKIKTNGKYNSALDTDITVNNIYVSGNWIYYTAYIEHKDYECNFHYYMYKIKTNGKEKQEVDLSEAVDDIEKFNNTDISMHMSKNWIYYYSTFNSDTKENKGIYKIKTDGTNNQEFIKYNSSIIDIFDDWIYFNRYDNKRDSGTFIIKTNGIGEKKINANINNITKISEWIYYEDDKGSIYKMRPDGTKKKAIK